MSVKFNNPYLLLIIIPFLIVVIGCYLYEKKKRPVGMKHQRLFLVIRCLMGILIILAMSGVHITWINNMTTTVFLVDVSDSASAYESTVEDYIRDELKNKPDNNQTGVVAFGGSTAVEQFISEVNSFAEIASKPIKTATDIESAINYAVAIIPQDTAKRIVLLTDGQENTGDVTNAASALKAQDIEFDVIVLDDEETSEVYISNMNIPDQISIGETFSISVTIQSNVACNANLYLYSGRTVKGTQSVALQTGVNNFIFRDTQTDVGLKNYRVVLETDSDKDTISLNNEYVEYTMVDTKPRVLVVEGSSGEASEFVKILDSIGIEYTVGNTEIAPTNINELNEYKEIILVNVHADDLNDGFMENVESYVKNYGGSVIAAGGDNSFALGQYRDTSLEEILPVDMDLKGKKEIPKMAIALVIDHSGSMASGDSGTNITKLSLAQQAAIEALDTLRENDEIGVLSFDDAYKWVVDLQTPDDRDELAQYINGIPLGGGTSIYPALAEAAKELEKSDAKLKHIILLTDGQDGFTEYDDLIDKVKDDSITLSAVAVGADSDTSLLSSLAEKCDGRYYYTDVNSDIPRIFAQEIFLSVGEYLVNREFYPVVSNYSNILTGVTDNGVPSLLGYIGSTAKDNAKVLLESDEGDPILSVMQYGIGRTVAWNSDVTNEWTANYAGTEVYQTLWNNIINWSLADFTEEGTGVSVSEEAGVIKAKYSTEDFDINSDVSVVATDEDGNEKNYDMKVSAPGEYECDIPTDKTGVYSINVRETRDSKVVNAVTTSAVVQYSKEYRVFEYTADFEKKVTNMGARILTLKNNVFDTELEMKSGSINIVEPCLLIALILFAFDIAFRRLQLNRRIKSLAARYMNTVQSNKLKKEEEAVVKEKEKLQKQKDEYEIAMKLAKENAKQDARTRKEQRKAEKIARKNMKNISLNKQQLNTEQLLSMQKKRNGK